MSQNAHNHGTKLLTLQQAGILGTIAEMLDDQTLLTVVYHVDEFCRSIPMSVVKKTLKQLFGDRWLLFLDSYISWMREICAAKDTYNVAANKVCRDRVLDNRTCPPFGPWGLGYDLEIAPEVPMANGYALIAALRTLNSIALNCENYDRSFIPAEPKECSINRIWFLENGRLVWIQYHSKADGYYNNVNRDMFNDETNYERNWSTLARLDGQVHLRDDVTAHTMINSAGCQEACPKEVGPFENELWDIGERAHPRCLWSSLWNAAFPTTRLEVRDHIFPVTTFRRKYCDEFVIPSMKGFNISFFDYIDKRQAESGFFYNDPSPMPLRFVKCTSTLSVIDLLHLQTMHFRGTNKLRSSRLSNGSKYLGALAHPEHGGIYLAIWRVTLPVPLLVWENGLRLSCDNCYWFIDEDWLITTCYEHGTRAYPLTSSIPRVIELTPFIPHLTGTDSFLKVCGRDNNILVCDSVGAKSCWVIKLEQDKQGVWRVVRLRISSDASAPVNQITPTLGFGASNCIRKIGKRYCLTTTGDLFDLHVAEAVRPDTDKTTFLSRKNQKGYSVLGLWESPVGQGAIIACCDSRAAEPMLELFSLNADGDHQQQLMAHGNPIRFKDIGLLVFSPDGKNLFVWSHNDETWGWLILLSDSSPGTLEPEAYIRKLSWFEFGNIGEHASKYPVFLTEDTIGIVNYKIFKSSSQAESRITYYNLVDTRIMLVRIDDKTLDLECSIVGPRSRRSINWRDYRRIHYPRWIDMLREKRTGLDYCASISYVGTRAGLSPGHRFLLYPAARDAELEAAPHIELCDLISQRQMRPMDVRQSWESFVYCLKLRKDYRRVTKYKASICCQIKRRNRVTR